MCPAARPRRGMVSPRPAQRAPAPTSSRGAAQQPRALAKPRDERLALRIRRPASAAQSTLQAVLRGDAAPRPRPPPFRPLGPPPPPPLLHKGARTQRGAPGKAPGARLQDRASGGAGRLPSSPRLPPPFLLPPSYPPSLAPSPSLRSPPPLTERLPYKIYESALSSRCRAPSYSQGSGAQPRGAASQGVFTEPAPGDDPPPPCVQVPVPAPGPVV